MNPSFRQLGLALLIFVLSAGCSKDGESDINQSGASVVRIFKIDADFTGSNSGTGTGFFVNSTTVVTNNHVVEDGKWFIVAYRTGDQVDLRLGELLETDNVRDLAILNVKGFNPDIVGLSNRQIEETKQVWAIGFPGIADEAAEMERLIPKFKEALDNSEKGKFKMILDLEEYENTFKPTFTQGTISKIAKGEWENGSLDVVWHSAKISPGNSGGPLLDGDLNLVGVNTLGKWTEKTDKYYIASHRNEVIQALDSWSVKYSKKSGSSKSFLATGFSFVRGVAKLLALALVVALAGTLLYRKRQALLALGSEKGVPMLKQSWSSAKPLIESASKQVADVAVTAAKKGKVVGEHLIDEGKKKIAAAQEARAGRVFVFSGGEPGGQPVEFAIAEADLRDCGGMIIIGRKASHVNLKIDSDSLSRQHATLKLEKDGSLWIEDRRSSNGVSVAGEQLEPFSWQRIEPEQEMILGDLKLSLREGVPKE